MSKIPEINFGNPTLHAYAKTHTHTHAHHINMYADTRLHITHAYHTCTHMHENKEGKDKWLRGKHQQG